MCSAVPSNRSHWAPPEDAGCVLADGIRFHAAPEGAERPSHQAVSAGRTSRKPKRPSCVELSGGRRPALLALRAVQFNHLVVQTQNEERGRPLAYEVGLLLLTRGQQRQRPADRT